MSISGKSILVTRASDQADSLIRLVEERGGIVILFPTIEIVPVQSWDKLDNAIDGLYMYDGVIFTSINGVKYFFQRIREREILIDELKRKRVFVVGEKTKYAVEEQGMTVTTMPEKFTSSDLAKAIEQEDLHQRTFLFPCGSLSPNTLADNLKILGASVDRVLVYETKKPPQENVGEIRMMLFKNEIDVVTFTSPSTFENFASFFSAKELKEIPEHTRIAVIGHTTAGAVKDAGIEADIVAKKSTVESLVEAIDTVFQSEILHSKSAHD